MNEYRIQVTKKDVTGPYLFVGHGDSEEEAKNDAYKQMDKFHLDPEDTKNITVEHLV